MSYPFTSDNENCDNNVGSSPPISPIVANPVFVGSPKGTPSKFYPHQSGITKENIERKLEAAERRRSECLQSPQLRESPSPEDKIALALQKRSETVSSFVTKAKQNLDHKMTLAEENRQAKLMIQKAKLKEHEEHVKKVRLAGQEIKRRSMELQQILQYDNDEEMSKDKNLEHIASEFAGMVLKDEPKAVEIEMNPSCRIKGDEAMKQIVADVGCLTVKNQPVEIGLNSIVEENASEQNITEHDPTIIDNDETVKIGIDLNSIEENISEKIAVVGYDRMVVGNSEQSPGDIGSSSIFENSTEKIITQQDRSVLENEPVKDKIDSKSNEENPTEQIITKHEMVVENDSTKDDIGSKSSDEQTIVEHDGMVASNNEQFTYDIGSTSNFVEKPSEQTVTKHLQMKMIVSGSESLDEKNN